MLEQMATEPEGLPSTRVAGFEVLFDCHRSDLSGDGQVAGNIRKYINSADVGFRAVRWNSTAQRLRPRNLSGRAGICC